eukprot:11650427-Alexandrium_andersonii.AAC.1
MSASLVGSEMCIRDSSRPLAAGVCSAASCPAQTGGCCASWGRATTSVSYTHLPLPTICSV